MDKKKIWIIQIHPPGLKTVFTVFRPEKNCFKHLLEVFFFFKPHFIMLVLQVFPWKTWHPSSTFKTTRSQTRTPHTLCIFCRYAGNTRSTSVLAPRVSNQAAATELSATFSGSSQLISVSTCLLCQEFSRLMSTLISQCSLLPVEGMRASQSRGVKINCNSQMKRI